MLPKEDRRVSLLVTGPRTAADFHHPNPTDEMDFFDLKGVIEVLLNRLGFKDAVVEYRGRPDPETFGPRCAEVWVNGRKAGILGELHPAVRAAYGLPNVRVALAELEITEMIKPH